MIALSKQQARRFMLIKHGLLGEHHFKGKDGILDFVRQVGCIQFDPIDVCGKNAELVLQSRIKGFEKKWLYDQLYEERELIDYFDKNLAIMHVSDWPYFNRYRDAYKMGGRSRVEIDAVCDEVLQMIEEKGPLSSSDIGYNHKVDWYWSDTKLSRAVLETLYFRGDLVVHHKNGTNKYYDLSSRCIKSSLLESADPFPDEIEHIKWRILRRIGAVGMLWNKPSDAWLNIWELKAGKRNQAFEELIDENKIIPVMVESIKEPLYILTEDQPIIIKVKDEFKEKLRCELLAPLDNFLWDRKIIQAVFDFKYKWEIYTPEAQRQYGYYVLPILYGDQLIGRTEVVNQRKTKELIVKNIWLEENIKINKKMMTAIDKCFERFSKFNGCEKIIRLDTIM